MIFLISKNTRIWNINFSAFNQPINQSLFAKNDRQMKTTNKLVAYDSPAQAGQ